MNKFQFEDAVLLSLKGQYISINKKAGFCLKHAKNHRISIANTTETLLILETLFNRNLKNHKLDCFNFTYIEKFLIDRKSALLNNDNSRIIDLAYCGIGLQILNKIEESKEIAKLLYENTSNTSSTGWGRTLDYDECDLFSTYLVIKLLKRLNMEVVYPEWIDNLSIEESGISFLPDDSSFVENPKKIESLVLLCYIKEHYFGIEIKTDLKRIINNYFLEKSKSIINAEEQAFATDPASGYTIFSFGLASCLLKNEKDPFYMVGGESLCSKLSSDFMFRTEKNIPYALEIMQLVITLKECYDPFVEKSYSIEDLKSDINSEIYSIKEELSLLPTKTTLSYLIILGTSIVIFIFLIGIFFKMKIENGALISILCAVFIPLIFDICGIIRFLVRLSMKMYSFSIRKISKKRKENK